MKLIKEKEIEGYFIKDIKKTLNKESYKDFKNWMAGKTVAIIRGKQLVYKWDYELWNGQ